ncbi:MAG: hypothetical protein R3B48_28335 [Kofleriaceae bacterium]
MDDLLTLAAALRDADFDDVEVVGFGEDGPRFDSGFRGGFPITWTRALDAEGRVRLRELIEAVPAAEPARCHFPPMGLRLGAVRASLCFQCDNAFIDGELACMDAGSEPARRLLEFLRAQAPAGWQSSE